MKYFKLIGCLILITFLVGCSESEWFQLFCSGKSDSWISDSFLRIVCFGYAASPPIYIMDSKCAEGFIVIRTGECVDCGEDAKFDVSVEKCICKNPEFSMILGDCKPKEMPQKPTTTTTQIKPTTQTTQTIEPTTTTTQIKPTTQTTQTIEPTTTTTQIKPTTQTTQTIEPTKGNDCTFSSDCSTWLGYGTCADANNINRYDCINGYCKLVPSYCSGGCAKGACQ